MNNKNSVPSYFKLRSTCLEIIKFHRNNWFILHDTEWDAYDIEPYKSGMNCIKIWFESNRNRIHCFDTAAPIEHVSIPHIWCQLEDGKERLKYELYNMKIVNKIVDCTILITDTNQNTILKIIPLKELIQDTNRVCLPMIIFDDSLHYLGTNLHVPKIGTFNTFISTCQEIDIDIFFQTMLLNGHYGSKEDCIKHLEYSNYCSQHDSISFDEDDETDPRAYYTDEELFGNDRPTFNDNDPNSPIYWTWNS